MVQPMQGAGCVRCGSSALAPKQHANTMKQRPKFGAMWILITICTCGLGFLAWLVMPRHNVTMSVDRWVECTQCGMRQ